MLQVYQKGNFTPERRKTLSWKDLNRQCQDCPDLLDLVDLVLSLPTSTAVCERGFNIMKQIKSDWRSHLDTDSINSLMTVQMLSPPIPAFCPDDAIELWHSFGPRARRPNFMGPESDEEDEEEEEDFVYVGLSRLAGRAYRELYEKEAECGWLSI